MWLLVLSDLKQSKPMGFQGLFQMHHSILKPNAFTNQMLLPNFTPLLE